MSVPEAVDNGYTVVFTTESVRFYDPDDCNVSGIPTLTGARVKRNRLFYITSATHQDAQCKSSISGESKKLILTEYFKEAAPMATRRNQVSRYSGRQCELGKDVP